MSSAGCSASPCSCVGLLLVVGAVVAGYLAAQKRREPMLDLRDRPWLDLRARRSRAWSTGSPARRSDSGSAAARPTSLYGTHDGRDLVAFDYEYTTQTSGTGKRPDDHDAPLLGARACRWASSLPPLTVDPENFLERFVGRLTDSDIDLESEDFNRAFTVSCPDRKFASDVLHPQMMEYLLAHPHLGWRFERDSHARDRPGAADARCRSRRRWRSWTAITDRIPEFVWLPV